MASSFLGYDTGCNLVQARRTHFFNRFFVITIVFPPLLPHFAYALIFCTVQNVDGTNWNCRVDVSWKYAWANIGIFRCWLIGNMGGRQLELYMPWHRYFAYTGVLILFCKNFSPFNDFTFILQILPLFSVIAAGRQLELSRLCALFLNRSADLRSFSRFMERFPKHSFLALEYFSNFSILYLLIF